MSMLCSHTMRFGTDNFGFITDNSPTDSTTDTDVIIDGSGNSTVAGNDGSTATEHSGGEIVVVDTHDGGNVSLKADSGKVTLTGGTGDSVTISTGATDSNTLNSSAGSLVSVTGSGESYIIISPVIINNYAGGGDATEGGTSDDGENITSTETVVSEPFLKKALLIGKGVWNCRGKSAITGFEINGANYNINSKACKCRFVFKLSDGKFYKIKPITKASGTVVAHLREFKYDMSTQNAMLENILNYGNHVGDIQYVNNIPDFIGKSVSPYYALQAASDSNVVPSIRLDLKTRVGGDVATKTEESEVYNLAVDGITPTIRGITADTTTAGGGSVTVKAKIIAEDGTESDWRNVAEIIDTEAYSIQFKFEYAVQSTSGSDLAQVNSVVIEYANSKNTVSGENAELYTTVINYEVPLQMCYCVVRHDQLTDSTIEAYVNFMHTTKHRELLYLGKATGYDTPATFKLGENGEADPNINGASIQLFGALASSADIAINNFTFNSKTSEVTVSEKTNMMIYATYDYNHDKEVWNMMTLDTSEPYTPADGTYATRFVYSLPDSVARPSDSSLNKLISNVRVRLKRNSGKVTRAKLGDGLNKRQLFVLPHLPDIGSIKFTNADGSTTYNSTAVSWQYNEETNILSVYAKKGTPIIISYSWQGEDITVHSISCGWSVA